MGKQNKEKQHYFRLKNGWGRQSLEIAFFFVAVLGLSTLTVGALVSAGDPQLAGDGAVAESTVTELAQAPVPDVADEQASTSGAGQSTTTVIETTTGSAGTSYVVGGTSAPVVAAPGGQEVPIADLSESEVLALDDETVVANAVAIADSTEVGDLILQAQEELGRDFTEEELAVLASGLKAQYAYEQALAEGRVAEEDFTAEEQEAIDEATLLQTGVDTESINDLEPFGSSGSSKSNIHPGGKYAPGIGVYPTQKGKILVSADWYKNRVPTGHAAIVIDQSSAYTALPGGVTIEPNDWYEPSRYQTAYGVDVTKATEEQEANAADWCQQHLGKPYNYLFIFPCRTDAYYCSSMIWQAYKANAGIDLDTAAYNCLFFRIVHPMELVDSSKTSLVYLQGTARTGKQTINGVQYTIGKDGRPR
jgi:uncharacterized protein YycO